MQFSQALFHLHIATLKCECVTFGWTLNETTEITCDIEKKHETVIYSPSSRTEGHMISEKNARKSRRRKTRQRSCGR